jgi:hypothetical protein
MWHIQERRETHVDFEGKETPSRPGHRWKYDMNVDLK